MKIAWFIHNTLEVASQKYDVGKNELENQASEVLAATKVSRSISYVLQERHIDRLFIKFLVKVFYEHILLILFEARIRNKLAVDSNCLST